MPVHSRQLRADGRGRADETSDDDGPTCPGSLIVVSNRQPYRHEYEDEPTAERASDPADTDESPPAGTNGGAQTGTQRSITVDEPTGGLTAGLDPVVQATDGTWIAWGDGDADFAVTDEQNCVAVPPDEEAYTLQRLELSEEAVESYYYGFSNRVLWPLCHGFPDLIENRTNDFEWYRTVNEQFADAVGEHAEDDSVIWLQDYHLALAPRMIRESVPESATVAHFWHIPWPTPETFQRCPAGDHVLEGLLGNDLLGFHVDRYADQFLQCVDQFLPSASVDFRSSNDPVRRADDPSSRHRWASTPNRTTGTHDRPIWTASPPCSRSTGSRRGPRSDWGSTALDYSKGIPERLAALERFFERKPDWRGEFTFIQKATPSRTDIETYERYGELVRSEVQRINRRFETADWRPIVYTEDVLPREDICALYRHADVMVVSPLIDGMNLVAQEYIAASVDGDSTLLLSDRTGAHEQFGSHALTIDPTDTDGFAAQIEHALSYLPTNANGE